jgi:hypothetical protein
MVLSCANQVPDSSEEPSQQRCEDLGVLVSLRMIVLIMKFTIRKYQQICRLKIRILCDNISVTKAIKKLRGNKLNLKHQYAKNH